MSRSTLQVAIVGIVVLCPMAEASAQDTVPEVYRMIYQAATPVGDRELFTMAAGFVKTTSTDVSPASTTLIAVPAGGEYRLNDNLSFQGYLLVNNDMPSDFRGVDLDDQLEIRPVMGVTVKTKLSDAIEIGTWLRYEARFRDVGGNDDFESRLRLRPYIDASFAEEGDTAWHVRLEAEPKYTIDEGDDFFNGATFRVSVGHSFSRSLSVDLKYSHDWTRATPGAAWRSSNDMITLQVVQAFGLRRFARRAATQLDD
jgi:hypothetical protein